MNQSSLVKSVSASQIEYHQRRLNNQALVNEGITIVNECHVDPFHRQRSTSMHPSFIVHVHAHNQQTVFKQSTSALGTGSGENLLTLHLTFHCPVRMQNLFAAPIEFRAFYTRSHPHHSLSSSRNVSYSDLRSTFSPPRRNSYTQTVPRKEPSGPHAKLPTFHGSIESGESISLPYIDLTRDPYVNFRLAGFGWR